MLAVFLPIFVARPLEIPHYFFLVTPAEIEGMTFFRGEGGCNFYLRNKLKSKILNDKKVYKQKYFSLS